MNPIFENNCSKRYFYYLMFSCFLFSSPIYAGNFTIGNYDLEGSRSIRSSSESGLSKKKIEGKGLEVKWHTSTDAPMVAVPIVQGKVVYAATTSFGSGSLYAMDANTGEVLWNFPLNDGLNGALASPLVHNNAVYVAALNGTLFKLKKKTGQVIWMNKPDLHESLDTTWTGPIRVFNGTKYLIILAINADDEGVVEFAGTLDNRITWFSLDPDKPQLARSITSGGTACYLENGWLMAAEGSSRRRVVPVAEIPAAMGGIVRYNISNALAAMCIATSLGIDDDAIRKGLAIFRGDEHDNPGRGNWFEHHVDDGVIRILVDFAHNQHGMQALADAVRRVPAKRVILLMGQAGDRPDKDIIDLTKAACSMGPGQLMVAELPGYERGRKPLEVPELIRQEALRSGIPEKAIEIFPGPTEATAEALGRARQGDLLVLLALTQRNAALSLVHEFIGNGKNSHG